MKFALFFAGIFLTSMPSTPCRFRCGADLPSPPNGGIFVFTLQQIRLHVFALYGLAGSPSDEGKAGSRADIFHREDANIKIDKTFQIDQQREDYSFLGWPTEHNKLLVETCNLYRGPKTEYDYYDNIQDNSKSRWTWPHEPMMNWFGWWAEELQRPVLVRTMQIIRMILIPSHMIFYGFLIKNTVEEFKHGTVISTVKSAFVSGPSTVACFKLYAIVMHRKSIKDITNSMDEMMSGILSRAVRPQLEEEMRARWTSCRKLYTVCFYFGCTVTTHATVTPLLQTLAGALLTDAELPFDSWPRFLIGYYYWALNTFCIGHVLYMFDATYFAMADNLQIHFAVLKDYLENLDLTKQGEVDLNLCLKNHMELLRLCRIFRRITRTVIVTTRMCSMLLLCAGTFVLTSAGEEFTSNDRGNLLSTLIYIAAVFFNYCRCADNIAHQVDDITTDSYSAQWVSATKSQKITVLNMMTISRMEPRFCGIASINLDTFVNVMRGVYSYYNFLTAVDVGDSPPEQNTPEEIPETL